MLALIVLLFTPRTVAYEQLQFEEPQLVVMVEEAKTIPELIEYHSKKNGLPVETMKAIAFAESTYRPKVKNDHSTATGLFQIVIGTWQHFKCTGSRTDAEDNIKCAMKIATEINKGGGLHHWNESADKWR